MRSIAAPLFLSIAASVVFAQGNQQPPAKTATTPTPSNQNQPPTFLPVCSTEKVNGDCYVNIDRTYPITMPTFQLSKGHQIKVYVFNPFAFEVLTLDPGPAQAFEASDQGSAILNAINPVAKGAVVGVTDAANGTRLSVMSAALISRIEALPNQASALVDLAKKIRQEIHDLNGMLDQALQPVSGYFQETNKIYARIREVESAAPRPQDLQGRTMRGPGVEVYSPNPFGQGYTGWRTDMLEKLRTQGTDTSALLGRLPVPCQLADGAAPGPWQPPTRACPAGTAANTPLNPNPLAIPAGYDDLHAELETDVGNLPLNQPDPETYNQIRALAAELEQRYARVLGTISTSNTLLAGIITKISTDMETLLANIAMASGTPQSPVFVGMIPPPPQANGTQNPILVPYKALGPQITYTVNAQNQIANSLLSLPAASQKQAVVTITALYASPRLEISTGVFLSWLPNRTFANYTSVTVTNMVPAQSNVMIDKTTTTPPLVIPFVAANWRLLPEFTWHDGRRGALYATLGLGLNPYDTQVEYVGGLSLSWRFLMFSPLVHLGRATHLTQGEQVGQLWCQNGPNASATSVPPACGGGPPAPTTKMYWTRAFALGISVRVPTTFSATNH